MKNGQEAHRAQPHEAIQSGTDGAGNVMTANAARAGPSSASLRASASAAAAAAVPPAAGERNAPYPSSPSGHTPVFPPINANRREGGSVSPASPNSPFFHIPNGNTSAFSASGRQGSHNAAFDVDASDSEVTVMDGQPVAPEKRPAGGELARRRHSARGGEAGAGEPYPPTGGSGSRGNQQGSQKDHHHQNNAGSLGGGRGPAADGDVVEEDGDEDNDVDCGSARTGDSSTNRPRMRYSESFRNQSYVKDLPVHLMPLAHEIHQLDDDDLAYISDVTQTMANRDLYSLLPYAGSNWFLPSIRECEDGEKHWELRYSWREGLILAIGGRRLSLRLLNIFIRVCFIVLIWFMLWNMLPRWLVEPGGYVWDPAVLVVVSAIVGGLLCRIVQMPPLVGVLWMGIMWNNIPTLKYLTHGIVMEVFDICSKLGLTVILARAGYKLAIKEIMPHWKQTALLATLPFALEGVSHSLIANQIFDYKDDYNWAFLQGMLCSIVSPAVVVPGSLYLQDLGYGRGVGPLSLMLSAVGIEIVIGVWCANFIIGLIFYDQKLVVAIVLGPVQFLGGILIGIALGVLFFYVVELIKQEADRLPNGKYTRGHLNNCIDFSYVIFLFACYTMVFLGYKVSLAGGGCVMCVFFSATVAHMWTRSGKSEHEDHKKYVASWLAFTWDQAMMPILFATMGAKINVMAIFNASFFPKAIICMVCSTAVRLLVTFCVQMGSGTPYKEKLLVCVGYLGKASAQASVGPIAANLVANMVARLPVDQKGSLDTLAEYANNVQQISAMYVMFMACVASFGLVRGGQVVLQRDGSAKKKKLSKNSQGDASSSVGGAAAAPAEAAAATKEAVSDSSPVSDAVVDGGAGVQGPRGTVEGSRYPREGSFTARASHGSGSDHHVSFASFEPIHQDVKGNAHSD